MSLTFNQAINKLQNSQMVSRSGWNNSNYLISMPLCDYICMINPNNKFNPCNPYLLNINDINGSDWQVVNS